MIYAEKLFRSRFGFAKGDDPENNTQSDNSTNQTDYRVGASESGVAVGAGGFLDQSFTDASRTNITTTDARQDNSQTTDARDFSDNSQTALTVTDSRDQSTTDNSVTNITTLDAELAKASLQVGSDTLANAAGVLETQIRASQEGQEAAFDFAASASKDSLGLVNSALEKVLEQNAATAKQSAEQQTAFLSSFYKDRESSDVKVVESVGKYVATAAAVAALAYALK